MTAETSSLRPPRRFLCLFLLYWASDRLKRRTPSLATSAAPLVLFEKAESALRLYALDARAEALGLHPGQPLAEARAIEPSLVAAPADPDGEEKDFRRLCAALTRYAPFVGKFGARDAFLDVTGGAHLFGGEAALIADARARLARLGFVVRAGLADSPGGAYAAAHYGGEEIVPQGGARAALKDLPVAALRLDEKTAETLRRLGLKRIGQLYAMPRAPLTARLGALLLRRLAQALGEEDEPIDPLFPPPDYAAAAPLVEPISSSEAILVCLERLTADLQAQLERDGKGGRRFELALYRVDNRVSRIMVGTARAERKPPTLLRLFRDRLADLHDERDAGFGYDLVRLTAFDCTPYETSAPATFDAPAPEGDLPALVARLANRLGRRRVCALRCENAHMPERSAGFAPWAEGLSSLHAPQRTDLKALGSSPLRRLRGRGAKDAGWGEGAAREGSAQTPRPNSRALTPDPSPAAKRRARGEGARGCIGDCPAGEGGENAAINLRPLFLLPAPEAVDAVAGVPDGPPARFTWRRIPYAVKKASGPERIAGDWRRPREEKTRDYYRVEDAGGRRFWIYREGFYGDGDAKWFLHGFFG